jgi:tight adherence protein B
LTLELLGFVAGCLTALGVVELASTGTAGLGGRLPQAVRALGAVAATLRAAGSEGRNPGAGERRRLLGAGAALALVIGTLAFGPLAGLVVAAAAPWASARLLAARREHYRRAVERGAPAIAAGVADALSGGHSLRRALEEVAGSLSGPPAHELRRVGLELALGARTDVALEALRNRVRSHRIDTLVAAALIQRRAGGDLARLLRDCAGAFEDEERVAADARAATAQARFTGLVVVLLPLGGAGFAELAQPGYLRALADSPLTAWLGGAAIAMQAIAALAIRHLGRVRA